MMLECQAAAIAKHKAEEAARAAQENAAEEARKKAEEEEAVKSERLRQQQAEETAMRAHAEKMRAESAAQQVCVLQSKRPACCIFA